MTAPHADLGLCKRLLAGEEAAFREVFDGYFPRLYRFALARTGNRPDDAVEAVQQAFCKAFEHLDTYRGEASLYGWMCRICSNVLADAARRRLREHEHVALLEDDADIEAVLDALPGPLAERPDRQVARADLVRLVQAVLDRLPGRYGDVLEWKYIDGLSVSEIGERLSIGPKAAESLLTRSRSAFRDAVATVSGAAELLLDPIEGELGG